MCTPCKILWHDKALVVTGYVQDTGKLVWDVSLGEGWVQVTVHKIRDSDCLLMRPLKQCRTIGEARGTSIVRLHVYARDYHYFTHSH